MRYDLKGKKWKRLPRKLKKKLFGKIGRRTHLASAIMDNKNLVNSIVNLFRV